MAETTPSSLDSVLGKLAVEKGLATPEELHRCVEKYREEGDPSQQSLADVLVAEGIVTRKQIERLRPEVDEQRAGQQIPGYALIARIGAGAMATVYKARQLSLDRLVAIKILPRKFSQNQQFVERFYAEGKAAAKLNHPNIVQAIDVGKAGEYHYFVMEYVDGHTVFDDITEHGPYEEANALKIIIQTAKALEHSHKAGFIHRDVKPKNIMITRHGDAKLADMGLARAVSDREAAEAEQGKAYGTPYYISPEQIRGAMDVDFRADIYSLGATMYHMVTGRVPFEGSNPSSVMHKHLKSELIPPDHLNPDISTGMGEIIEVCMAKDPNKRYASTSDLLEDLQAVAQGEPPLQARKVFDLASLSALGTGEDAAGETQMVKRPGRRWSWLLMNQSPLVWLAAVGWVLVFCLIVVLLLVLLGG